MMKTSKAPVSNSCSSNSTQLNFRLLLFITLAFVAIVSNASTPTTQPSNGRRHGHVVRFEETKEGDVTIETDLMDVPASNCRLRPSFVQGQEGHGNPKHCINGPLAILTADVHVDDVTSDSPGLAQEGGGPRAGWKRAAWITNSDTGMIYEVRIDGSVVETHTSDYPDEDDPIGGPPEETLANTNTNTNTGEQGGKKTHDELGRPFLEADNGDIVDILVIWTDAMQAEAGSEAQAQADVINGVNSFNTAAENSGVNTRLRLVYSAHDNTNYVEKGSTGECLADIALTTDGNLDYVHGLRDTYGADVVALVTAVRCGTAYVGPNNSAAMFSVTGRSCIGGYTFAHEVAHNFGCNHDKGTMDACGANANGIAYGYREPTGAWRSVLAYPCRGGECDAYAGSGACSRVPQFSNPNDEYNGKPAGAAANSPIGETNNVQQLNDARVTMANHRATVVVDPTSSPSKMPTTSPITDSPTSSPSKMPTTSPSISSPTSSPSKMPTTSPSKPFSTSPTGSPTASPSASSQPTSASKAGKGGKGSKSSRDSKGSKSE